MLTPGYAGSEVGKTKFEIMLLTLELLPRYFASIAANTSSTLIGLSIGPNAGLNAMPLT
ncbi:hypothetical protein D3C77_399550 [compost metagenome]